MQFEFFILDTIEKWHTPLLNSLFPIISSFSDHGRGWILLSILFLFIPRYRKAGITMLLSLIFCLFLGNLFLKPLIARPRPYSYFPEMSLLVPALNDFSFPSGHTFASFSASTALFLWFRKEGLFAHIFATLIAFSRLYLYVHFPTDVFAGIILGIASGWFAYKIVLIFLQKRQLK